MDYSSLSKRRLLELIAEQTAAILQTQGEEKMALTPAEQAAFENVTAKIAQVGADVGDLVPALTAAFSAKDNLIAQLQAQLSTAQTQLGVDAATIAADRVTIDQQNQAATDSANQVISNLTSVADAASAIDTAVTGAKSTVDTENPPPPPPPVATPPVITVPPTSSPSDTTPTP